MNKERIAKLKEVALKAPKNPGEWPFYLRSFQAAASPEVILELIALAEHSLSAQDEVLTDKQNTFDRRWSLAQDGFGLERNDETGEYVAYDDAVAALHAALAAAPSPAVAVKPAQLAVATHAGAHSTTVVINLIRGDTHTCIYSADHSANGETIGVSDLPDGLFQIAAQAPEPCGGCGEKDPAKRCIGCGHTFATPSPSLAVREKPNADCSGEPANCPDNEGYGCACDPMNKAAKEQSNGN